MLPLRYGVVVSGNALKAWQLACIRALDQSALAQFVCVINRTPGSSSSPRDSRNRAYDKFFSSLKLPSQSTVSTWNLTEGHNALIEVPLPLVNLDLETQLRHLSLDFLLLFGEREMGLDLTDLPKYGVWYFAHSDIANFSSTAPCFWEVYHNHDITGAMLLRMGDGDAAGTVLKAGYFPTHHSSFRQNVETVFGSLDKWPAAVCSDISRGAANYFNDEQIPAPSARYASPNAFQILALKLLQANNALAQYIRTRFYLQDWTVGRIKGPPSDFIGRDARAEVTFLYPYVKGRFLADPCVVARDSKTYLFCEEYRYESYHGVLVASELSTAPDLRPQLAIEEGHHLSYPHVFEHDGAVYCIPESAIKGKVCLYRSVDFPYQWEYVRTLIDDFRAADSTLVSFGNKWWLFCTSNEAFKKGYNSHLYIWYADDLDGQWTAHPRNPVKIDARCSRPAGNFFTHDTRLYRPAQDCSRAYGQAIRINRIDKLTETEFEETVVGTIRPPAKKYNKGIHTITSVGEWCIVDVKRYVFNPAGIIIAFYLAVRNLAVRLGVPKSKIRALNRRLRRIAALKPHLAARDLFASVLFDDSGHPKKGGTTREIVTHP